MKALLVLSLIFGSVTTDASEFCAVGATYTTSKGATFVCVKHAQFGSAWKSPDGVVWGPYLGDFSNGEKIVKKSDGNDKSIISENLAIKACLEKNTELPEIDDYARFLGYFEADRYLTKTGIKDMLSIFPDMKRDRAFWTSTPNVLDCEYCSRIKGYADVFIGVTPDENHSGVLNAYTQRSDEQAVRCISK
jgi:hypothetical protein